MGNGALAIGPKLPRPSSTLPSRQAREGRYRITPTIAMAWLAAVAWPSYTRADIGHTVIGDEKTAADHVR